MADIMTITTQRKNRLPQDSTAGQIVLALAALSILLLLFALRFASSSQPRNANAASRTDRATESIARPIGSGDAVACSAKVPEARTPIVPAPVAAADPVQAASELSDAERERMRKDLTSAVEASLSGALDPAAITQAAVALLHLHVEKGILPTTADDGSLRYPLSSCPAGVKAELWVARSTGSTFEDVLSLRMQLAPPSEPYLLEGAVRKPPIAYVQAFLDPTGRMKDLVIMTDIAPSGESRKFGLNVLQGRTPQGIIFHVDMNRPDEWKASSYGLDDGADRTWDEPVAMLSDPRPGDDTLAELGSGLLGLLYEARN